MCYFGTQSSGWEAILRRRDFIILFGGAAGRPVIGFLSGQSRDQMRGYVARFQPGLNEAVRTIGCALVLGALIPDAGLVRACR
jgi:hypothetical protein